MLESALRRFFSSLIILLMIALTVPLVSVIRAQAPEKSQDSSAKNSNSEDGKTFVPGKDGNAMPSCYFRPDPPYTKEAKDAKFQGTIVVQGVVMIDERVTNLRILKSPGLGIDESILTTLKTWKCKPATHEGKPVPARVPFQITFRLK
jgi:TonB family protein